MHYFNAIADKDGLRKIIRANSRLSYKRNATTLH